MASSHLNKQNKQSSTTIETLQTLSASVKERVAKLADETETERAAERINELGKKTDRAYANAESSLSRAQRLEKSAKEVRKVERDLLIGAAGIGVGLLFAWLSTKTNSSPAESTPPVSNINKGPGRP